ncbi:MAG: YqhA family protein [Myxococcota bacterium]
MNRLVKLFEQILWNSRLVILTAVVASLLSGLAMFYIASVDAIQLLVHLSEYASTGLSSEEHSQMRALSVAHVVEVLDGYLLGTMMLIFSVGFYELFIKRIDENEVGHVSPSRVLKINSLDDLKTLLGKVVLMILIVQFFEQAMTMDFEGALEVLYMAIAIALIGLALYLTHAGGHSNSDHGGGDH